MNRIEKKLEILKQENKKAFITYTTAGLPDLETTAGLIHAQEKAGVDILEIGIPFSDPVADGAVIQNASYKAIQNGAVLTKIFDVVRRVRKEKSDVPIVFMMYYNTLYHYGIEKFVGCCIECGVDGLIVPDLPFEEQKELKTVLDKNEDSPILIQMVSPLSKQRINMILENARGFVYCMPKMKAAGKEDDFYKDMKEYLAYVKTAGKIPVMLGFDVQSPQDIKPFKDAADGVIVNSYLINILEESNYSEKAVNDYVSDFKAELNK